MIKEFFTGLTPYLQYFPLQGYELIFLLCFAEALAFVGVLIPGTVLTIFIGFLAYLGEFNMALAFVAAVLGALAGDVVSYYWGKRAGLDLKLGQKSIFKYLYIPEAGDFLLKSGGFGIVTGRFLGPTRAFVPFFLGAAGEKERKFFFYDFIGVLIWAAFFLYLGELFGNGYDYFRGFLDDVQLVVIVLLVIIIGPLLVSRFFRKEIKKQIE